MEAEKLRARLNSVKSRRGRRGGVNRWIAAPRQQQAEELFVFPPTRVIVFSSQEKFLFTMKNKILFFHFFLVDFESDF